MRALFKGAKLEVESVIREVCERVLYDASVNKETQRLRAQALGILGEVFLSVTKEGGNDALASDAEYVRVDTSSSKARESGRASSDHQRSPPQAQGEKAPGTPGYEPYKRKVPQPPGKQE